MDWEEREVLAKIFLVWLCYAVPAAVLMGMGIFNFNKDQLITGVLLLGASSPWFLYGWLEARPVKRHVVIRVGIDLLLLVGIFVGWIILGAFLVDLLYDDRERTTKIFPFLVVFSSAFIIIPIFLKIIVFVYICILNASTIWEWRWWAKKKTAQPLNISKADAAWDENPVMPPEGLRLGVKNGSVYRYNGQTHLITFAQTRSGKGTTSIIPNLLEYDGPVFVIDPKGENALNSIGYRQNVLRRRVAVLDPFNESCIANARFNPMECINPESMNDDCSQIAESLITTQSKDPFWDNCAKSLLAAAVFYVYQAPDIPDSEKNLITVYDRTLIDRDNFFKEMSDQEGLHHTIRHAIADVLKGAENTKAGIFTTLRENLSDALNEDKIRENLSGPSTFETKDFLDGNTDIFLVLPLERLFRYKRWLRLVLSSIMKDLLRKQTTQDTRKKLFILDEFGNLGHLQVLENAFTTVAGRNAILWPFIQSFQQLEKDYPNAWRTILSQAGHKEVFNLGDDNPAAEYVSKILGNTTVIEETTNSSRGNSSSYNDKNHTSGSSTSTSIGTREKEVPLLRPDQVSRFDTAKKIILRQGEMPVQIYKMPYFQDPELSSRWKQGLVWVMKKYPDTENFIAVEYPQAYAEIKEWN